MHATQCFKWGPITGTALPTSPPGVGTPVSNAFAVVVGGAYQLACVASTWGTSAQLQQVGPDGATLIPVSAELMANGGTTVDLVPGSYVLTLTGTFVGFYATLANLPQD